LIPDRTDELQRLYSKHIARADEAPPANGHRSHADLVLSDEEVIGLCRDARNSVKFERLYDVGDKSEYDQDDSRADQALVSLMAFYTRDPEQLDRLFRGSALHRPEKWGRRPDYRRRTIERAITNHRETYSPPGGSRPYPGRRR
jgi:putative DNA primase/helicase